MLKCREWQCSEMYMCVGLGRSTTQEQLSVTGLKIPISVYVCTWVFTEAPLLSRIIKEDLLFHLLGGGV